MPELVRDEFNAYKNTPLQEHLYELIFKEADQESSSSMEMPMSSFGPEELPDFAEVEALIPGYIAGVNLFIKMIRSKQRKRDSNCLTFDGIAFNHSKIM
jgi:hypothetical protein